MAPLASFAQTFYGLTNTALNKAGFSTVGGTPDDPGNVSWSIPGLGKVTNVQARIADEYAHSSVPDSKLGIGASVAKYTGEELLNGLFAASLLSGVVNPRLKTISNINAEQAGSLGEQGTIGTPKAAPGPKTFQLYEGQPTIVTPQYTRLNPEFVKKLSDTGIDMSKYDPAQPTFFRFQLEPNGQITGKVIAVKPSFLDNFFNMFKGDVSKVPPEGLDTIATKEVSIDQIEKPPVKSASPVVPVKVPTTIPELKQKETVLSQQAAELQTKMSEAANPETAPKPAIQEGGNISVEDLPPQIQTRAQEDWTNNYSEDYLKLDQKITEYQKEIKNATTENATAIQSKLDEVLASQKKLEDEFITKYTVHPTTIADSFSAVSNKLESVHHEIANMEAEQASKNEGRNLTLTPSKAVTPEEKAIEVKKLFGENGKVKEPLVTASDIKKIIREVPEFKKNPVMTVNENKELTWKGEKQAFKIRAEALGLQPDTLKVGDSVRVNSITLKGKVKQMRVEDNNQVVLSAELIPGLSKFISEDVIPKGSSLVQGTKNVFKEIATLFNPVGQASAKAVDIIMSHKGTFEQELFRLERATKEIKKMWDKQPEKARLDFMSNVELGKAVPEEYKDIAKLYADRLANAYKAISEFKDVPFIENFFPHFWEKPDVVEKEFMASALAKRPLAGPQTFLKQRIFDTINEGIKAGYKPVSTNPEELMQIYETNVKKFVMAQNIKTDMLEKGFWQFVSSKERAPSDFARIDDNIARIYFPQETATGGNVTVKGGEYWAQKDVARLINNYLSKDLIMDTALGRGMMNVKNTLNAFQLGFSAFHLTMESLDTVITKFSIGLSKLVGGDIAGGLKDIATSPAAPVTFFKSGQKFFNGDPELLGIEKDLFTGGASFREKQYYKNTVLDTFFKNVREGNLVGAAVRTPLAAIEGLMRPLFSYYIPRLKVGAFRELFAQELERNSADIQSGITSQEKVARDVWNNIENRLGELNYDNLFWNRTLKSGLMLAFRAVGWNLGTVRELGGAFFQDVPEQLMNLLSKDKTKKVNFTPKMSYAISLFVMVGALGAVYQYLHTGKKPEGLKDLYYPRNGTTDKSGEEGRVEFPTYLKDIYQFTHSPIQTVKNKMAPEISAMLELMNNKDFYGDYIRNTNDNLPTQAKQVALFLASQFAPFTLQQNINLAKGNTGIEQQVESFLGIIKAPKEVIQSDYQKMLYQLYTDQVGGKGPSTPEQKEIAQRKTEARNAIKNGDTSALKELIKDKIITPSGAATFIRNAKLTTDERVFKGLSKEAKKALTDSIKTEGQ